jgi:uncharacterized protein (DUF305 family)
MSRAIDIRCKPLFATFLVLTMFLGSFNATTAQDATPTVDSSPPTASELCGQAESTEIPESTPPTPLDSTGIQFDLLFIDLMIPHHLGAVEMSIVAEERATHPELRLLSQEIIAAQQPEIDQMTAWRDAWYPGAPAISNAEAMAAFDQMTNPMPGMGGMPGSSEMMMGDMHDIGALCETNADHFDLQFIDEMVAHHQSALLMAQAAPDHATHDEIKALATAIIASQQQQIDAMLAWRSLWYPDATPVHTHG